MEKMRGKRLSVGGYCADGKERGGNKVMKQLCYKTLEEAGYSGFLLKECTRKSHAVRRR